jgi:hypothetical protein
LPDEAIPLASPETASVEERRLAATHFLARKQKTNRVTEYCVPRSTTQWREGVLRKYLNQSSSIYERFGHIQFGYLCKKQ